MKEKINAIIEPIINNFGAYLVDSSVSSQGKRTFVKVTIQTLAGITLDEIADITKAINANESLDQLFRDGYFLEVSSPGIDSKLTEYRDFPRNIGRTLKVFHNKTETKSPVKGILIEVNEDKFVLDVKGEHQTIHFSELDYAKVEIKW